MHIAIGYKRNRSMSDKIKKRWGDRRDGRLMRDIDPMHAIVPYVYPNRADNEAFIQESVEMEPIFRYVDKKNAELKARVERGELPESALDDPYKPFYVMLMALVKVMHLRPGLNRFVCNMKLYQKDEVSIGFTVKKSLLTTRQKVLHSRSSDRRPQWTFFTTRS